MTSGFTTRDQAKPRKPTSLHAHDPHRPDRFWTSMTIVNRKISGEKCFTPSNFQVKLNKISSFQILQFILAKCLTLFSFLVYFVLRFMKSSFVPSIEGGPRPRQSHNKSIVQFDKRKDKHEIVKYLDDTLDGLRGTLTRTED